MKSITKSLLESLDNDAKPGMTLYDYIVNVCDGEIDMDVSDKDIDMMVAFCHDTSGKYGNEYPEMTRFLNLLAKRTKIVRQINGPYEPILVCDFSSALKPYNEEWKKFFNMEYSEFDEDEAYYEAVVNLEPLISGNAGESTYKEFCDIMEGKKTVNESVTVNEADNMESTIDEAARYLFDEGDSDYLPDYEEFIDYIMDIPKDLYDKAKERALNALEKLAEHNYSEDHHLYLELNDNHTMWELDTVDNENVEAAWQLWDDIATDKCEEFKNETGVELSGAGRSARHMVVEPTYDNCMNFDYLQEVQERLEQEAIDQYNREIKELFGNGEMNESAGSLKTHKMNLIKYNTKGYIEATDGLYKGEPIVDYKEKDFKKGTSVLTPFICDYCSNEFYVKSSIHDFFKQGDFDDPYEVPKEDFCCPKCKNFSLSYNGYPLIKEPGTKENMTESNVDDALARMKQAREEVLNLDKNAGARKKQLINNIEELVYEYDNGISDGVEEPFKSDNELIDYVYSSVFDIKSDGQGGTRYANGICRDLKYLGKDYIISEIKRIGHEAGVVEETMTEATDDKEWEAVCKKFCEKIGAELLFVNNDNFGYEDKDGNLVHMYASELEQYLKDNKLNESEEITAEVTYHDEDGTRDYTAGKLSDGRYFLIGQQEQILVSDKDLPSLAKKDMDDYSYDDEDGDKEFIEALENGTSLENKSDLAQIIINASRKYLDDGCYLLQESVSNNIDEDKVASFIKDSVEKLQNSDYTNCKYNLDDKFALYVGWSGGYEAEETNEYEIHSKKDPSYCINAVIGIRNDADWSDLDYINRPYYEAGDIFEAEWCVSPSEDYSYLANSIIKMYDYMLELLDTGELLTEGLFNKINESENSIVELDVYTDANDEDGIIQELRAGGVPQSVGIEVVEVNGPAGGNPLVRLIGDFNKIKKYLDNQDFEEGQYKILHESNVLKPLYIFSNAQSQEGRSDAESYIHNYKAEAPNLDFKVHREGDMWFVDFIGSEEDIRNYLIKLGWFTPEEIDEYDLIKRYTPEHHDKIVNEDASIDGDPDLNKEQVNADVDYWTDVDEANTEDVSNAEPIGTYTVSNNSAILIYQIEYDINDRVLVGDSSNRDKAHWTDIIYEPIENDEVDAYFYYGDIKVPFNEVMRTDI